MATPGVYAALDEHVIEFWPDRRQEVLTWDRGPILERVPNFHVRCVAPTSPEDAWIYVSIGASAGPNGRGLEFFILSPFESVEHVETLAMVAHFQSFDAHALEIGDVVNLGRPWLNGSHCDRLVVTLPYPYGPQFEWSSVDAGNARFLWMVPISGSEASFIKARGFSEFEDRLEISGVDVLDIHRSSVI